MCLKYGVQVQEFRKEKFDIELSEEKLVSERDGLMNKLNIQHNIEAKTDFFKETCHKFLSKLNDPKIVTERVKKDIIKLVIDEVVIDGEKLKIAATIPLPSKIQEREIVKTDTPDTFNSGATLGPINPASILRLHCHAKRERRIAASSHGRSASSTEGSTYSVHALREVKQWQNRCGVNQTKMDIIWTKPRSRTFGSLRGRHKKINTTLKPKVFVGMSGGVDSSVAAYILKEQGYDVTGVYLLCFVGDEDVCRAKEDMDDARKVALQIGIPFYVWNLEKEYKKQVIDYMVDGYRRGLTPNPDVMCNREIKFGIFLRRALVMGADYIATGHHTRLRRNFKVKNLEFSLLQAKDLNKDQSYFLWTLTQDQLAHCLFPIGDYLKSEVREIARSAGLLTADKKDSQGVCFMGEITLSEFLGASIPKRRGDVVTVNGEKVGEHDGAEFCTIGQRHIGLANRKSQVANSGSDFKPLYVARKDIKTNTLVVAEGDDDLALYRKEIKLTAVNFINSQYYDIIANVGMLPVMVRVRYRQPFTLAELFLQRNSASGSPSFRMLFEVAQKAVAPGQSAVFYSDTGELLGGGVIL